MDENTTKMEEVNQEMGQIPENSYPNKNTSQQIAAAIIVAGVLIAGAILLKGNAPTRALPVANTGPDTQISDVSGVSTKDLAIGNADAKLKMIVYADFQCPFCGKFAKETESVVRDTFVKNGQVQLVYRDFAFLGPESVTAAEAARCAGDQGKFWEYHDYLYSNQGKENGGGFTDSNLKSYAGTLGLNATTFNQCLDTEKFKQAVIDSTNEGSNAGVRGTPKGFLMVNGKVVDTIDGAQPTDIVISKIEAAIK